MTENTIETIAIDPGETIYDGDGQVLGRVTGLTDDGFEVQTLDPDDARSADHETLPGQRFGEGYLMWRCRDCGTMGKLEEGFPATCPNCGAPDGELTMVLED